MDEINTSTNPVNSTPLPRFNDQPRAQMPKLSTRIIVSLAVIFLLGGIAVLGVFMSNKPYAPRSYKSKASAATLGACEVTFTIPSPTPTVTPTITATSIQATPLPTSTPVPSITATGGSVCNVQFVKNENTNLELTDTAVCWKNPKRVEIKYKVISLPPGGPYRMQTDWYTASPTFDKNRYDESQIIEAGKTYSFFADWPGVTQENMDKKQTVEIHAGLQVVTNDYQLLTPNCTDGLDYYWTVWVTCPTPAVE